MVDFHTSAKLGFNLHQRCVTYIMGLFGAVVNGVSVKAEPLVPPCLLPCWGAAKLLPETGAPNALLNFSFSFNNSFSSGVLAPSELGVEK